MYHYWFHLGEVMPSSSLAIPIPQFVGTCHRPHIGIGLIHLVLALELAACMI
jgi:hypothetical protein